MSDSEKFQDSSQPRGNPESSPGKISPGELPGGVPEGVPKNPEKPRKIPPQNTPPKKGGSGTLLLRGEARGCTENHDSQVYRKYKPLISRPCRGVFGVPLGDLRKTLPCPHVSRPDLRCAPATCSHTRSLCSLLSFTHLTHSSPTLPCSSSPIPYLRHSSSSPRFVVLWVRLMESRITNIFPTIVLLIGNEMCLM